MSPSKDKVQGDLTGGSGGGEGTCAMHLPSVKVGRHCAAAAAKVCQSGQSHHRIRRMCGSKCAGASVVAASDWSLARRCAGHCPHRRSSALHLGAPPSEVAAAAAARRLSTDLICREYAKRLHRTSRIRLHITENAVARRRAMQAQTPIVAQTLQQTPSPTSSLLQQLRLVR